jgi:hypothetical protein
MPWPLRGLRCRIRSADVKHTPWGIQAPVRLLLLLLLLLLLRLLHSPLRLCLRGL